MQPDRNDDTPENAESTAKVGGQAPLQRHDEATSGDRSLSDAQLESMRGEPAKPTKQDKVKLPDPVEAGEAG